MARPVPETVSVAAHREGARLHYPSAGRNKGPIAEVLLPVLPTGARVLEIGSGSGEHGAHLCALRTDITWTPSDPGARERESQAAYAGDCGGRMRPPLDIDVMQDDWWTRAPAFGALVCINVIHISPWRAAEGLAVGAGASLSPNGVLYLYGPYLEGEATAPSNLAFDADLKARNPEWGVRPLADVAALMADHGLALERRVPMPANNLSLIFRKAAP